LGKFDANFLGLGVFVLSEIGSLIEMRLEKTRGNDIKFDIREYISE